MGWTGEPSDSKPKTPSRPQESPRGAGESQGSPQQGDPVKPVICGPRLKAMQFKIRTQTRLYKGPSRVSGVSQTGGSNQPQGIIAHDSILYDAMGFYTILYRGFPENGAPINPMSKVVREAFPSHAILRMSPLGFVTLVARSAPLPSSPRIRPNPTPSYAPPSPK